MSEFIWLWQIKRKRIRPKMQAPGCRVKPNDKNCQRIRKKRLNLCRNCDYAS